MRPLAEAEAIMVPSGLTAIAPISVSWAGITKSIDLSTTKYKYTLKRIKNKCTYRNSILLKILFLRLEDK